MSIKEAIISRLTRNDIPFDVLAVDKNAEANGRPSTEVYINTGGTERTWQFADDNRMDADHVADVVLSYILKGKR